MMSSGARQQMLVSKKGQSFRQAQLEMNSFRKKFKLVEGTESRMCLGNVGQIYKILMN